MAGSLLEHHIEMLRLRPDAPYANLSPSEMLKEWKRERMVLTLDRRMDNDVPWLDPDDVEGDE